MSLPHNKYGNQMEISCRKCQYHFELDEITLTLEQNMCHKHNVILYRKYKYICPQCTYHQAWMTDSRPVGYCNKCHETIMEEKKNIEHLRQTDVYHFEVDMTCDEDMCRHDVIITFEKESIPITLHRDGSDIIKLHEKAHITLPPHFTEDDDMGMSLFF
jgi:hypothetical protein